MASGRAIAAYRRLVRSVADGRGETGIRCCAERCAGEAEDKAARKLGVGRFCETPRRLAQTPYKACSTSRRMHNVPVKLRPQSYHDIERIIEFDFVRATEAAALNSLAWLGRGDKEAADAAACDAMRGMFDLMNICGEVVIGEGIKDEAPGIFKGEQLGTWLPGA